MLHNTQDLAIQELKEQIGELMQKIDARELMQKIAATNRDLAIQLLTEQIGELCQKFDAKEFLTHNCDQSKLADMEQKIDNFGEKLGLVGHQLDQMDDKIQAQGQLILDLEAKINAQTKVGDKIDDMQKGEEDWRRDLEQNDESMHDKIDALFRLVTKLDLVQIPVSERPPGFVADKIDDIHSLLGDKIDDIKRGQERNADDLQKCVSQLFDENDDMRRWNDGEANDMRAKIDVLICLVSGNPQTQT